MATNNNQTNRFWVLNTRGSFADSYKGRFVEATVPTLEEAARHLYSRRQTSFKPPVHLCIAPLPYTPAKEEAKWISSVPYRLLIREGFINEVVEVPKFSIQEIPDRKGLAREIEKYISGHDRFDPMWIIPGISFDLGELLNQCIENEKDKMVQRALKEFGLEDVPDVGGIR